MVDGADGVRHLLCGRQVGRAVQADGEAVDTGPPRFRFSPIVHAGSGVLHGHGGDDRTVETTADEQAIGHVAHQVAVDRPGQFRLEISRTVLALGQVSVHPIAPVKGPGSGFPTGPHVARREDLDVVADGREGFHFGGDPESAVRSLAEVQGDDADGIPANQPFSLLGVEQDEGIHPGEVLDQVGAMLPVQGEDDLTIAAGLERVALEILALTQFLVVVDLAIDCQDKALFWVFQGLGSTHHIDDGQALMGDDGVGKLPNAGPVRAAVALNAGGLQHFLTGVLQGGGAVQKGSDGTHGVEGQGGSSSTEEKSKGYSNLSGGWWVRILRLRPCP